MPPIGVATPVATSCGLAPPTDPPWTSPASSSTARSSPRCCRS
ncbi:hypothetical protein [Lysobacter gummosus]